MEEPFYEFEINTFTGQWSIRRPHRFVSTHTSEKLNKTISNKANFIFR